MEHLLGVLAELHHQAAAGGGPKSHERLAARGKMPVRERIALAIDRDSPFLEISPLAAWGSDYTVGGGMVLGIGVIAGTECVMLANDPSVLGGAMTTFAVKKLMRALEIARHNRMPYIQFVESAGADLLATPTRNAPCAPTPPTSVSPAGCSTRSPSCPSCASPPCRWCSAAPPPVAPTNQGCRITTS
ncbi:MAG: carboxyl transferase domain-containing protein [Acidimicrobiales bacterium]